MRLRLRNQKRIIASNMDNTNNNSYLIIVAVLEGRNFETPEAFHRNNPDDLQIFLEARFNEEILVSDGIPYRNSSNPEINTELAWELDKRTLHLFGVERKAIKLQCFIENVMSGDKHLVGYTILDVRSAQKITAGEPKYEWKTMLNPKFKGNSKFRPELFCSLQLVRGEDHVTEDVPESRQSFASIESNGTLRSLDSLREDQVEMDIQVKETNGWIRIWDSKKCSENDCHQKYQLSVVIASASNLQVLAPGSLDPDDRYYFKYSLLGSNIGTKSFAHLSQPEIPPEKISVKIETTDLQILKVYFSLNSRLEIQFCQRSPSEEVLATTAVMINSLIGRKSISPVAGEFTLTHVSNANAPRIVLPPESQSRIGVYIELEKVIGQFFSKADRTAQKPPIHPNNNNSVLHETSSHNSSRNGMMNGQPEHFTSYSNGQNSSRILTEDQMEQDDTMRHFCFSIDIRSIGIGEKTVGTSHPCFLQYSYAVFGTSQKISTSLVSLRESNFNQTFKDGFFAFNFASSFKQVHESFSSVSLILELIEKTNVNMLRGIAVVNLREVLSCQPDEEMKRLMVAKPYVMNADEEKIAQLNIILCLQDLGPTSLGKSTILHLNDSDASENETIRISNHDQTSSNSQIEKMFVEAAVQVELWKKQEMKKFQEELKRRDSETTESLFSNKLAEIKKIEDELQETLDRVKEKETLLSVKEKKLNLMDQSMQQKYEQMEKEISQSIKELTSAYEDKLVKEKDRNRILEEKLSLEMDRSKFLDDQNTLLMRKLRIGDHSPKKSLTAVPSSPVAKRKSPPSNPSSPAKPAVSSLTRTNSVPSSVRNVSKL